MSFIKSIDITEQRPAIIAVIEIISDTKIAILISLFRNVGIELGSIEEK